MTFPVNFIETLCSKLCHDLISPVGAIHNGLELFEEMGADGADDVMQLIAGSAAQAGARLKMFRLVYGAGGADSGVKPADIHQAMNEFLGPGARISQDWSPAGMTLPDDLPQGYCKILGAGLLLVAECLPKGGVIGVTGHHPDQGTVLFAKGPGAKTRPNMRDLLTSHDLPGHIEAKDVHAAMTGILAAHYNMTLDIEQSGNDAVSLMLKPLR